MDNDVNKCERVNTINDSSFVMIASEYQLIHSAWKVENLNTDINSSSKTLKPATQNFRIHQVSSKHGKQKNYQY